MHLSISDFGMPFFPLPASDRCKLCYLKGGASWGIPLILTNDAKAFEVLTFFERVFIWGWFLMDTFSLVNGGSDNGGHEIYQWNEPVCCALCLPFS